MESKLISISEIITKGWQLFIKNYQQFITPLLILLAPMVLFYLGELYTGPGNVLLSILLFIIMMIINIWISMVLILIADKIYKSQSIEINKILESSFAKLPSFLLVMLLVFLIIIAPLIILGLIVLAVAFLVISQTIEMSNWLVLGIGIVSIVYIAYIVYACALSIYLTFSTYINLLEDKENKGRAALKSSYALTKGHWWGAFVRIFVPGLLIGAIALIAIGLIGVILALILGSLDQAIVMVIINLFTSVISVAITPLSVIFSIILYYSLKSAKENMASQPTLSTQPTEPTMPTPPLQ